MTTLTLGAWSIRTADSHHESRQAARRGAGTDDGLRSRGGSVSRSSNRKDFTSAARRRTGQPWPRHGERSSRSMSILSRYTMREVLSHLAGVMVIVVAVFLVRRFASFLGDAAEGSLPAGILVQLLALRTVMALPSLLPVGIYAAVLLGLARLYDDNELTALAACGVPIRRTHAAVVTLAILAATVAAGLSFWARPWAAQEFHALRDRATIESGIDQMTPRRFYETTGSSEQVVFAEGRSATDPRFVENVFVQQRDSDRISILVAARAIEVLDTQLGYRFLHLLDGYRYDFGPEGSHYDITQYQELVIRTPLDMAMAERPQDSAASMMMLFHSSDREDIAELQWRIASPVSVLCLVLLAIALSQIHLGQRYAKL